MDTGELRLTGMPKQKPGHSRQDYATPDAFLEAVMRRLGDGFSWDLAANEDNHVVPNYYSEEDNALTKNWAAEIGTTDWMWLNPPFKDITPWAKKAWEESQLGAHIAMLVPLSTAQWWRDWVHGKAHVILLHGRLTFMGEKSPYPKDCALLLYNRTYVGGYTLWDWKNEA